MTTYDKDHDRIEQRTVRVSSALNDYLTFPYVHQVYRIDRRFEYLSTGKIEEMVEYGVTSLSAERATPEVILALRRGHWGIENKVHYVRDMTFDEDRCRARSANGAPLLALLRNLALAFFRFISPPSKKKTPSTKRIARYLAAHLSYALLLVGCRE